MYLYSSVKYVFFLQEPKVILTLIVFRFFKVGAGAGNVKNGPLQQRQSYLEDLVKLRLILVSGTACVTVFAFF